MREARCLLKRMRAHSAQLQFLMKDNKKVMMKKVSLAALVFAMAMFVAVPMAHATTITEIQASIANLKAKTQTVAITGRQADKDLAGLLGKLNEATLKVDQGKFCDAIQKLNDFKARVNQLIVAGKINQDPAAGTTGQEVLADADASIALINNLIAESGGTACVF
jgi:heme-binding NEAT domain protein